MSERPDVWPSMNPWESAATMVLHSLPAILNGPLEVRPGFMAALGRITDSAVVVHFDRLRDKYHGLPVWGPGGRLYLLTEADAREMLRQSAVVFSLATKSKQRVLRDLEPEAVIISRGETRERRRELNDHVLGHDSAVRRTSQEPGGQHYSRMAPRHAEALIAIVDTEVDELLRTVLVSGKLDWSALRRTFERIGRQVCLGSAARDDEELSDLLAYLRSGGRRDFLAGRARKAKVRREFESRVMTYGRNAESFSLAGMVADFPPESELRPFGQVAHWLLSMSYLAPVTMRALALLHGHPRCLVRVYEELDTASRFHEPNSDDFILAQPYLRAVVLDAARLWPVVPNLWRTTTEDTSMGGVRLPANTSVVISALHLARGRGRGPNADAFSPDQWVSGEAADSWAYLPFSRGPGACPGQDLGVFLVQSALASLLRRAVFHQRRPVLFPDRPMPRHCAFWRLGFTVSERVGSIAPQDLPSTDDRRKDLR